MPDFTESLQGRDLGHLRIIAQTWGVELAEQDAQAAVIRLKNTLLDPANVNRMLASLGAEPASALKDLSQHSGRLPWAQFCRTYGEVREMGPGKRDRERPYDDPISAAEVLWYRGFVARAFFDSPGGPEEFAYIPDDLLELFPHASTPISPALGRTATAEEYARIFNSNDRLLDHACTVLAAMRIKEALPERFQTDVGEELAAGCLMDLLLAAGLVDEAGELLSEPVRLFLEAGRGEALANLFSAWRQSVKINELRQLPGLVIEGNWENDPLRTRETVLGYLATLGERKWWSLEAFIAAIKQRNPDFQRPAGDYDSWFIKDKISGEYLRGFEHWDDLDGRLIRYLITGPLYWLGVLDLACPEIGQQVTAFRSSSWSKALLRGAPPKGLSQEVELLAVRSDARLSARRLVPRAIRYQLARFCDWVKETPDEYQYRLSPGSLLRAQQQGLKVSQLLSLLERSAKAVPPSLVKALERWEKQGSEARIEKMVVLRLASEEILQALRKSRASRFLGEPLGPSTIAIKPGAVDKVLGALAELGYLGEIRGTVEPDQAG